MLIAQRRWLVWLMASLLAQGGLLQSSSAGGEFRRSSPESSRYVDISKHVRSRCSGVTEKELPDGVTIQVLADPNDTELAQQALARMEQVHDVLADRLGLRLGQDARFYLYPVSMKDLPPSVVIRDKAAGTAVFVLIDPAWSQAQKLPAIERGLFETLSHEWTHGAMFKIFRRRSVVNRKRWILEGAAAFFEYEASRRLSPDDRFQVVRALYVPLLNLASTSLGDLDAWEYPRWPPDPSKTWPIRAEADTYGAALGLFLRVAEHGGVDAVWRFLKELDGRRRLGQAETNEVLVKVTGKSFDELAAVSPMEKAKIYDEAAGDIRKEGPAYVEYGLAVVERFPDRAVDHIANVVEVVKDPNMLEGIRIHAARVAASQANAGLVKTLLEGLEMEPATVTAARIALPFAERRLKDDPVCGLEGLVRLASVEDRFTREEALEDLREASGEELSAEDLRAWVDGRTKGKCDHSRERAGQRD